MLPWPPVRERSPCAGIPLCLSRPGLILESLAIIAPLVVLLTALVARIRVTTRLYADRLEIHAFACRPDSIPLGDIVRFEIGTFTPVRAGLICSERIYVMRGHRGIEIVLAGRGSVIVGSRDPEALAEALGRAMAG